MAKLVRYSYRYTDGNSHDNINKKTHWSKLAKECSDTLEEVA